LGIGTSSPAAKLNTSIEVSASATKIHYLLSEFGTTADSGMQIKATNSTYSWDAGAITFKRESSANSYGLVFATSSGGTNATQMTLNSAGNLGLGVTPSIWTTGKALELGTVGNSIWGLGSSNMVVGSNTYLNGTFKYANTAAATYYQQSGGVHYWHNAPSGTAGTTATFTQAMTLDASNNLFLGGTTSSYTAANRTVLAINGTTSSFLSLQSGGTDRFYVIASATQSDLGTLTSTPLTFNTNATERARITSGGYFKASNSGTYQGSTGAYHELRQTTDETIAFFTNTSASLTGTVRGIRISYTAASPNDTGNYLLYCDDSTTLRAGFRSNGGLANYAANNVVLSDRREKTNFAPATSYLEKICAIPVQTYNYIDQNLETDAGLTLGVVAQDVQAVAPELVSEGNWGTKEEPKMRLEIYQTDLQYALMKCIQEQQAMIESLRQRLSAANL
jgi:hypothetical protein